MLRRCVLLLLCCLAACGDYPRPFEGNPGATALRLATPPPARLAIAPVHAASLTDADADVFADALAKALAGQDVPAVAETPKQGDWTLKVTAEARGNSVVPVYTINDPAGTAQGTAEGPPVPGPAWTAAKPATLWQAAADAAPRLATLLTNIDAARHGSDAASIVNRQPRIGFHGVTGAPGDGNALLARFMRAELAKLGEVVQDTDKGADYVLACAVSATPTTPGKERVEIQWIVSDLKGGERGKIVQLNEISPHDIDPHWGEVAVVVAQEAAAGVKEVILRQHGK